MPPNHKQYIYNNSDGEAYNQHHLSHSNHDESPTLLSSTPKQEVVNKERIQRLQHRLSGLNVGLEASKTSQMEGFVGKMHALEERFNSYIQYSNTSLLNIQEQLDKLKRDIDLDRGLQERHNKDVQKICSRVNELTQLDKQTQRECEMRLFRTFNDKIEKLKEDMFVGGHARDENGYSIRHICEVEIPRLHEAIQQEAKEREKMERRIHNYTSDEISRLSDTIKSEKIARDEQTSSLLSIIEQVVSEVKSEVQQEHQSRQASEEMLVQLMEKTIEQMRDTRHL